MIIIAALLERIESVAKAARQARWPAGSPKGGQFRPKGATGGSGGASAAQSATAAIAQAKEALTHSLNAAVHPRAGDDGGPVIVALPTMPSGKETWRNPKAAAVFVPGGKAPATLNGVAMKPWKAPTTDAGWNAVEGQMKGKEPPLPKAYDYQGNPKRPGAGVVITEPDGRVWVVEPTNHFGGYQHSFPKGGKEAGIKSLQANAIKEAWEESGLKVQITGVLGDYEGDTSIARYYTATRTGGTPTDVGWESQAVKLVPPGELGKYLNRARDQQIATDHAVLTSAGVAKSDVQRAERVASFVAELIKSARQARYPKGHPLGGQFKPKAGAKAGRVSGGGGASAAQVIADAKSMLSQFQPQMLTGKNPDNSSLKAANKKIGAIAALANAGDVAALQAIKPTEPGKGANPYQKGVWKAWNDAVGHATSVAQAGAGATASPKARTSTAPMKLTAMSYAAPKPGGSNPGGIYKDAGGVQWLVKGAGGNPDMAKNEVLAARLYNAAGANAPEMRLVELGDQYGGGLGVATRMIDGPLTKPITSAAATKAAQEHFATDVWLANWDAVGLSHDNIVITQDGKAMRIDPGGALLYRAQGSPKGAAFNKLATEWDTLRDPAKNPQAAAVFGKMTASELADSAAKLSLISDDTITKLVNQYGPGDAKAKADLAETLLARKQAVMASGKKAYPGLFSAAVAEVGGVPPKATNKPANVDDDGLATYVIGADGKGAPVAVVGAAAVAKPKYSSSTKAGMTYWDSHTKKLEQAIAGGDVEGAANLIQAVNTSWAGQGSVKTQNNLAAFNTYAGALLAQGASPAPATTRAKATAAVEAASAAAAVKPKASSTVAPAMPEKPPASALSSATYKNAALQKKVDQIEAIAAQQAAGTLSKADAEAQISALKFGVDTYNKKGAAYQADVLAALGSAAPAAAQAKPKAPSAQNPKISAASAKAAAVAAAASAKAKPKTIDASRLTTPPDFNNWNGAGKGLSSKSEVNEANQSEVKAIQSMAASGNLAALKAYQPTSPSKHVASYLQQVIEDVNLQLNPPPRLSSIKVGGGKTMDQAIKALAAAAKPLESPSQILNKLALYPVLGKAQSTASAAPPQILKWGAGLTESTYAAKSSANFAALDDAKQKAVIAYTGSKYQEINSSFRAGAPTKQALDADAGIRAAGVELKAGTVLSRKVGMSSEMAAQLAKHGEGKIIQEFGISSTSINPTKWGGNVHLRMTAGPGVKGLYVGNGSAKPAGGPISVHSGELEIILPASQRMLITKVHPSGVQADGYGTGAQLVVDVTLLPND